MTFPLGSMVDSFQQGVQWGQQLRDRQIQQHAQAALFNGVGGPPPGPAGPSPMPPQNVGMPGAQPMPSQAAPSPQAAPVRPMPQQPPPQAAPIAAPSGPPPMAPAAAPPPTMKGAGPAAPGGPPVSGVARPTGSLVQDSRATLMSIAADIKQRNPNIDPRTLFAAVEQQIKMMKGVEPETRAMMQNDLGMQRIQMQYQEKLLAAKTPEEVARIRGEYGLQIAEMNGVNREDIARIAAGSREQVAKIGAGSRVTVAQLASQSREHVAQMNNQAKEDVAADRIDADLYKSDNAYHAAVDSHVAGVTGKAPQATPIRRPTPRRGGGGTARPAPGGTAAPGSGYRSLQELKQAFENGEINADEAKDIARKKGWAR